MKLLLPFCTALLLIAAVAPVRGEDRRGMRVNVVKKTLNRADGRAMYDTREISRDMTLKLTAKNISMKEVPAGNVEYVILIKRWALSESGTIERYKGTLDLQALRPAQEAEVQMGDFHIGGHMHGSSDRHVDQLEGWKAVLKQGEEVIEFFSGPNFASLDKRAVDAKAPARAPK